MTGSVWASISLIRNAAALRSAIETWAAKSWTSSKSSSSKRSSAPRRSSETTPAAPSGPRSGTQMMLPSTGPVDRELVHPRVGPARREPAAGSPCATHPGREALLARFPGFQVGSLVNAPGEDRAEQSRLRVPQLDRDGVQADERAEPVATCSRIDRALNVPRIDSVIASSARWLTSCRSSLPDCARRRAASCRHSPSPGWPGSRRSRGVGGRRPRTAAAPAWRARSRPGPRPRRGVARAASTPRGRPPFQASSRLADRGRRRPASGAACAGRPIQ